MAVLAMLAVLALALVATVQGVTVENIDAGVNYRLNVTQSVTLEGYINREGGPLLVGYYAGWPKKRSLVQFEDLPSTCDKVKSALMYLKYTNTYLPSSGIARTVCAHQVKKEWNETATTATVQFPGLPWNADYLALDNVDAKSYPTDCVAMHPLRPYGWVEFDVTAAVELWRCGQANHGLLVLATNEDTHGSHLSFESDDNSDATQRPFVHVLCEA